MGETAEVKFKLDDKNVVVCVLVLILAVGVMLVSALFRGMEE
jgi:hypothetical protein